MKKYLVVLPIMVSCTSLGKSMVCENQSNQVESGLGNVYQREHNPINPNIVSDANPADVPSSKLDATKDKLNLIDAVYNNNQKLAEELAKKGVDKHIPDPLIPPYENNILYCIMKAVGEGHVKIADQLLHYVDNIDKQNDQGDTPLHKAVENNSTTMARLLIKHKAKVNMENNFGETPLSKAVKNNNISMARYLVSQKAIINSTDLYTATSNSSFEMLSFLLRHDANKSANMKAFLENNPLFIAVKNNKDDIVSLLLKHGANKSINMKTYSGKTPLHKAVKNNNMYIIRLLLKYGANESINMKNNKKETPIDIAKNNRNQEIVNLLEGLSS
ncbi:MAG: ankyrin repeat domain-containing protein [Candidatus Cardinium sp.]|nr:ankyrin repeat domain-containing protein [Candidatus Cardinium sp.]